MKPFRQCSVILKGNGDLREVLVTKAPSVAAVGWIPFYSELKDVPNDIYLNHPFARPSEKLLFSPSPFAILFASGNLIEVGESANPNPVSFSDQVGYISMLNAKNYRGALALDRIRIWRNQNNEPIRATFELNASVGFTPMRVQMGKRVMLQHYSRGRGSGDYNADTKGQQVEITCWVRFKVGAMADYGCYVLSGKRAPSAILKIVYFIGSDSVRVEFMGSRIPSQSYYVAWNRWRVHDMLAIASSDIDSFLDAGECKDTFCRRNESYLEPITTSLVGTEAT